MRNRILLSLLSLFVAVASAWAATTSSSEIGITGQRPTVVFTCTAGTTADVVCTDAANLGSKRGQVYKLVSGGQTLYVEFRFHRSSNGFFVDGVAAATTTALASAISGLDLSTTVPAHPSPTHDAADDSVATQMVGYTGS